MKYLLAIACGVVVGCGGPNFTNLGNGVAVPIESVDRYVIEHGVTRTEARARLRAELDQRRNQRQADDGLPKASDPRRQIAPDVEGSPVK